MRTVGAVVTGLAGNIRAAQSTRFEAVLGSLLLRFRREIPRRQEPVDEGLVLTDAIAKHASVVTIVVDAPLDVDNLARSVDGDGGCSPVAGGLVVVDGHAGVVAAGPATAYGCNVEIGPRGYRFKDAAFWAAVQPGLAEVSFQRFLGVLKLGSDSPRLLVCFDCLE